MTPEQSSAPVDQRDTVTVEQPPRQRPDAPSPWLRIESFEYWCDDGQFATLRVTGALRNGALAPKRPALIVRRFGGVASHQPVRTQLGRRFRRRSARARKLGSSWTLTYRLPVAIVRQQVVSFELAAGPHPPLALATPALTHPASRARHAAERSRVLAHRSRPSRRGAPAAGRSHVAGRRTHATVSTSTRWVRRRGRDATVLAFAFALGVGIATTAGALADSSTSTDPTTSATTVDTTTAAATTPTATTP